MNNYKNYKIFFFILSIMGVSFSGYMSSVKFFSSTCAFNETCPYFLGMPACYFGFAVFLALFIFSLILLIGKWNLKSLANSLFFTSMLGVLFAGYFSIGELPVLFKKGFSAYLLGLPTCVMGAVFFIIIFIASIMFKNKLKSI